MVALLSNIVPTISTWDGCKFAVISCTFPVHWRCIKLHWLPIAERIKFKLHLLAYHARHAVNGRACTVVRTYLTELIGYSRSSHATSQNAPLSAGRHTCTLVVPRSRPAAWSQGPFNYWMFGSIVIKSSMQHGRHTDIAIEIVCRCIIIRSVDCQAGRRVVSWWHISITFQDCIGDASP